MRLVVLQHARGEGLGSMLAWFRQKQFTILTCHVHLGEPLPACDEFDWLVVMGGPQSVYEEQTYPWLVPEKQLIREAIAAGKKVLGVCLGGQLIASALGAAVYANSQSEIGWFPIRKTDPVAGWLPDEQMLLSWHNDTFDVPVEGTAFASSDVTACQGFCVGPKVWALQFHVEAEPRTAGVFLAAGDGTLPVGPKVQSFAELAAPTHLPASAQTAAALLEVMWQA